MGADEITAFLTHLAVKNKVSASTQNQVLFALLFLYRDVLKIVLPRIEGVIRAKKPEHLPVVFTSDEAKAILARLSGIPFLAVGLLYSAGLRLSEALRLLASKTLILNRHKLRCVTAKARKTALRFCRNLYANRFMNN